MPKQSNPAVERATLNYVLAGLTLFRFSGTDPFLATLQGKFRQGPSFDFFDQMGDNMLEYGDTRPYIINDVSTQLRQDQNGNWIFN